MCRNIFWTNIQNSFCDFVFSMVVALLSQSSVYISGKILWIFWQPLKMTCPHIKTLLNYSVLFVILNLTAVLINFAINRMVTILYSNTFYSITRTVSHHIQSISLYKEIKIQLFKNHTSTSGWCQWDRFLFRWGFFRIFH